MQLLLTPDQRISMDQFIRYSPGFKYYIEDGRRSGKTTFAYYLLDWILKSGQTAALFKHVDYHIAVPTLPAKPEIITPLDTHSYKAIASISNYLRGYSYNTIIFDDADMADSSIDFLPLAATSNIVIINNSGRGITNSHLLKWVAGSVKTFWQTKQVSTTQLPPTTNTGNIFKVEYKYGSGEQSLKERNKDEQNCVQCGRPLFIMGRTTICTNCEK